METKTKTNDDDADINNIDDAFWSIASGALEQLASEIYGRFPVGEEFVTPPVVSSYGASNLDVPGLHRKDTVPIKGDSVPHDMSVAVRAMLYDMLSGEDRIEVLYFVSIAVPLMEYMSTDELSMMCKEAGIDMASDSPDYLYISVSSESVEKTEGSTRVIFRCIFNRDGDMVYRGRAETRNNVDNMAEALYEMMTIIARRPYDSTGE